MQLLLSGARLPPEQFQAIGKLTAQWSFLEWQVGHAISIMLQIGPKEGRIVTTQMNMRPKLEILELLSRLKLDDDRQQKMKNTAAAIRELHPLRNEIVHGLWAENAENTGDYYLVWASGNGQNRIKPRATKVTTTDVENITAQVDDINRAMDAMRSVLEALRDQQWPRPETEQYPPAPTPRKRNRKRQSRQPKPSLA